MGCSYDQIKVNIDTAEAKNGFVKVFNSKMKELFYGDEYGFDADEFELIKNTYHTQIWGEPLFECTMIAVDEVLETMKEFIVKFPTVKFSSEHFYDDCGDEGYVKCKYSKNILTVTRKTPYKKKEVECYELNNNTWRIK